MRRTGRNRNSNDEATLSNAIALNVDTSIKILDANPDRIFVCIDNNDSNMAVWIKLQAKSVDNDMKGIFLPKKGGKGWQMTPDNMYTGEISAIADGGTPDIFVTEY